MEAAIQKKQPHKIDIGAVFTLPPKDHHTVKAEAFKPLERYLPPTHPPTHPPM